MLDVSPRDERDAREDETNRLSKFRLSEAQAKLLKWRTSGTLEPHIAHVSRWAAALFLERMNNEAVGRRVNP